MRNCIRRCLQVLTSTLERWQELVVGSLRSVEARHRNHRVLFRHRDNAPATSNKSVAGLEPIHRNRSGTLPPLKATTSHWLRWAGFASGGRLDDVDQILALKDAYNCLDEMVGAGEFSLSKSVSQELHKLLARHEAIESGSFRQEVRSSAAARCAWQAEVWWRALLIRGRR
jgi:hypothetical protein